MMSTLREGANVATQEYQKQLGDQPLSTLKFTYENDRMKKLVELFHDATIADASVLIADIVKFVGSACDADAKKRKLSDLPQFDVVPKL